MARRVFFSFHYQRDIWRVNQVRNCWVTQDREAVGFWDGSLWEESKRKGDAAIRAMIDRALVNTSVTVVLIGAETAWRKYVQYEIIQSHNNKKGLLGVYINGLEDRYGYTDVRGSNPFDHIYAGEGIYRRPLSQLYPTYDWKLHKGFANFGTWVEQAARAVGR